MARILVIDDEEDMRFTISMILGHKGHVMSEAYEANMAYSLLEKEAFDLILLDIRIPGTDGIQILKEIHRRGFNIPVIMLTGYHNIESAVEATKLGAKNFLKKPFDNNHLISLVESVLREAGKPVPVAEQRVPATAPVPAEIKKTPVAEEKPVEPLPVRETPPVQVATKDNLNTKTEETPNPSAQKFYPGSKLIFFASLLVFISLIGGALLFYFFRSTANTVNTFDLPFKNVSAITWKDNELWIADWFTYTVYQTRIENGKILTTKNYYLPQYQIAGMAFAGDILYTCDITQKLIRKHKADSWLTVETAYHYPGRSPSTLFWDGNSLWSCDSDSGMIYKHKFTPSLGIEEGFRISDNLPVGIAIYSGNIWTVDGKSRKIYKRSMDSNMSILGDYSINQFLPGTYPVSAFAIHDNNIWLAFEGVDKLYELPVKSLKPEVH